MQRRNLQLLSEVRNTGGNVIFERRALIFSLNPKYQLRFVEIREPTMDQSRPKLSPKPAERLIACRVKKERS